MAAHRFKREQALEMLNKYEELKKAGVTSKEACEQLKIGSSTVNYWKTRYLGYDPSSAEQVPLNFKQSKPGKKTRFAKKAEHFTIPIPESVPDQKTKIALSMLENMQTNLKMVLEILKS